MIELATIVQATAIVSACWAIISGVGAWKREFIGKRKIELAEETLSSFLEIKDAISFIRNPWSNRNEGDTRKRSGNESEEVSHLLDRGYIVYERYESKKEIFVRFNTLKYRFMAVFGTNTESIFNNTNATLQSIFSSAQILAKHYWPRQNHAERMKVDDFNRHLKDMERHEGIFWDNNNIDDEIRKQLSEIQKKLEMVTKSCFEEPMKSWFTKIKLYCHSRER